MLTGRPILRQRGGSETRPGPRPPSWLLGTERMKRRVGV